MVFRLVTGSELVSSIRQRFPNLLRESRTAGYLLQTICIIQKSPPSPVIVVRKRYRTRLPGTAPKTCSIATMVPNWPDYEQELARPGERLPFSPQL